MEGGLLKKGNEGASQRKRNLPVGRKGEGWSFLGNRHCGKVIFGEIWGGPNEES